MMLISIFSLPKRNNTFQHYLLPWQCYSFVQWEFTDLFFRKCFAAFAYSYSACDSNHNICHCLLYDTRNWYEDLWICSFISLSSLASLSLLAVLHAEHLLVIFVCFCSPFACFLQLVPSFPTLWPSIFLAIYSKHPRNMVIIHLAMRS